MTFEPGPANPQPMTVGIHVAPSFDVTELLPPGCADRLRQLRQTFHDRHALTVPFTDLQEANVARIQAEQRLTKLQDHQQLGGFGLPASDSRVIEAERLVE